MKIPDNTKIQSIDIAVKNLDKTLNFYKDLIGFQIAERDDEDRGSASWGPETYQHQPAPLHKQ
jgi:catechol-2,3-dioxygenase